MPDGQERWHRLPLQEAYTVMYLQFARMLLLDELRARGNASLKEEALRRFPLDSVDFQGHDLRYLMRIAPRDPRVREELRRVIEAPEFRFRSYPEFQEFLRLPPVEVPGTLGEVR